GDVAAVDLGRRRQHHRDRVDADTRAAGVGDVDGQVLDAGELPHVLRPDDAVGGGHGLDRGVVAPVDRDGGGLGGGPGVEGGVGVVALVGEEGDGAGEGGRHRRGQRLDRVGREVVVGDGGGGGHADGLAAEVEHLDGDGVRALVGEDVLAADEVA